MSDRMKEFEEKLASMFDEDCEPVRIDGLADEEKNMLITCSLTGGAVSDAGPGSVTVKRFALGTCEQIRKLYAMVRKYLNEKYPEIRTVCTGAEFGYIRDAGGDDFIEFDAEGFFCENTYNNKFRAYVSALGEVRDTLAGAAELNAVRKAFRDAFPSAVVCDIDMSDYSSSVSEAVIAGNFNGLSVSEIIEKTKNILLPDRISPPKTGITVLSSPEYNENSSGDAFEFSGICDSTRRIDYSKTPGKPINISGGESVLFEFYVDENGKTDIYFE